MIQQKFQKKKTFTLFLALLLAFSLTGCGSNSSTGGKSATDSPSETTEATESTTQETIAPEVTEEAKEATSEDIKEQAAIQTKKPQKGDTIVTISFKDCFQRKLQRQ